MADGRILGMPPRTALITAGGALAAGVVYFWWKNRQSQASSAPVAATGCTDSSGNAAPCPDSGGIDYSGELGVIQTELEGLLQTENGEQTAGTGTGTGTGTTTATRPATPAPKLKTATATAMTVIWAKVAGAATYTYTVTSGGKTIHTGTTPALGVTVSGLKKATSYTFHLKACNASGCSAESAPQFKTLAK